MMIILNILEPIKEGESYIGLVDIILILLIQVIMYVNQDIFVLIKIKDNDNNVNIDNPLVFKT